MLHYTIRRVLAALMTMGCVLFTPRLSHSALLNFVWGMSVSALTIWTVVSWTCGWPKFPAEGPDDEITEGNLLYPDGTSSPVTVVVHRSGDKVTSYEPSVKLPPRTRLDMSEYRKARDVSS